jgi:hypothetical protein
VGEVEEDLREHFDEADAEGPADLPGDKIGDDDRVDGARDAPGDGLHQAAGAFVFHGGIRQRVQLASAGEACSGQSTRAAKSPKRSPVVRSAFQRWKSGPSSASSSASLMTSL